MGCMYRFCHDTAMSCHSKHFIPKHQIILSRSVDNQQSLFKPGRKTAEIFEISIVFSVRVDHQCVQTLPFHGTIYLFHSFPDCLICDIHRLIDKQVFRHFHFCINNVFCCNKHFVSSFLSCPLFSYLFLRASLSVIAFAITYCLPPFPAI